MEQTGATGSTVEHAVQQRLAGLADRPVADHVVVLSEVHRLLQDALATLDEV